MNEIKLPFGQDATGRIISIDAVSRGLACELFCPECKSPLVAVKGDILQHHFRHYSTACEHAAETTLHLFAKQCICDQPELLALPKFQGLPITMGKVVATKPDGHTLPSGLIPDAHIEYDSGETLAVEVWVRHQSSIAKVETYNRDGQTAIEIDLTRFRFTRKIDKQWREIVLTQARRIWLCPPKSERDRIAQTHATILAAEAARLHTIRLESLAREAERIEAQKAYEKLIAEHAEKAKQEEERQRLEAIRRQAEWQVRQVEEQKQRVEAARIAAEHKHAQDVLEDRLRREMIPPSLQDMVEAHGGYNKITQEAWAAYDEALATWQSRHAEGVFWQPPFLALQQQKQGAYWRQKKAEMILRLKVKKGVQVGYGKHGEQRGEQRR